MISFQNDILPLKNELYRLALRITLNPAEAEDVVQETMMKVWNRRDEWERIESIEAFCLTICRNLSLDKLRRMDNQVQSLDSTIDPSDLLILRNMPYSVTACIWYADSSTNCLRNSALSCSCVILRARAIVISLPFSISARNR